MKDLPEIPETRGRKSKYDFRGYKIGETRSFKCHSTGTLIGCAKVWCMRRGLSWRFRVYKINGKVKLVRIK